LNIKHWLWHAAELTRRHLKKLQSTKKCIYIIKKHEVTYDNHCSLSSMIETVLVKRDQIEQNWQKLGPIWTQKQNYDSFDKTWRKLGPRRYFNLFIINNLSRINFAFIGRRLKVNFTLSFLIVLIWSHQKNLSPGRPTKSIKYTYKICMLV